VGSEPRGERRGVTSARRVGPPDVPGALRTAFHLATRESPASTLPGTLQQVHLVSSRSPDCRSQETGIEKSVDRRRLTQRKKSYFEFQSDSPPRKPSVIRLVVSSLVVIVVVVSMLASGYPNAAFVILSGAVLGTATAVHRRWPPRASPVVDPQGWRMDHNGNWRWWNGSAWTDSPPGETPRKIGPEIEW
jgi:hypothetical protein